MRKEDEEGQPQAVCMPTRCKNERDVFFSVLKPLQREPKPPSAPHGVKIEATSSYHTTKTDSHGSHTSEEYALAKTFDCVNEERPLFRVSKLYHSDTSDSEIAFEDATCDTERALSSSPPTSSSEHSDIGSKTEMANPPFKSKIPIPINKNDWLKNQLEVKVEESTNMLNEEEPVLNSESPPRALHVESSNSPANDAKVEEPTLDDVSYPCEGTQESDVSSEEVTVIQANNEETNPPPSAPLYSLSEAQILNCEVDVAPHIESPVSSGADVPRSIDSGQTVVLNKNFDSNKPTKRQLSPSKDAKKSHSPSPIRAPPSHQLTIEQKRLECRRKLQATSASPTCEHPDKKIISKKMDVSLVKRASSRVQDEDPVVSMDEGETSGLNSDSSLNSDAPEKKKSKLRRLTSFKIGRRKQPVRTKSDSSGKTIPTSGTMVKSRLKMTEPSGPLGMKTKRLSPAEMKSQGMALRRTPAVRKLRERGDKDSMVVSIFKDSESRNRPASPPVPGDSEIAETVKSTEPSPDRPVSPKLLPLMNRYKCQASKLRKLILDFDETKKKILTTQNHLSSIEVQLISANGGGLPAGVSAPALDVDLNENELMAKNARTEIIDQMTHKIEELESENKNLMDETKKYKSGLDEAKAVIHAAQRLNKERENELATLKSDFQAHKEKMDDRMKDEINHKVQVEQSKRARTESLKNQEIDKLKTALSEEKKKSVAMSELLTKATEEGQALRLQLTKTTEELELIKKQYEGLCQEFEHCTAEMKKIETKLTAANECNEEALLQISSWKAQYEQKCKEVVDAKEAAAELLTMVESEKSRVSDLQKINSDYTQSFIQFLRTEERIPTFMETDEEQNLISEFCEKLEIPPTHLFDMDPHENKPIWTIELMKRINEISEEIPKLENQCRSLKTEVDAKTELIEACYELIEVDTSGLQKGHKDAICDVLSHWSDHRADAKSMKFETQNSDLPSENVKNTLLEMTQSRKNSLFRIELEARFRDLEDLHAMHRTMLEKQIAELEMQLADKD